MAKKAEYNWLDDPFNPEKQAEDDCERAHRKGCGISFLAALVLAIVILVILYFVFLAAVPILARS